MIITENENILELAKKNGYSGICLLKNKKNLLVTIARCFINKIGMNSCVFYNFPEYDCQDDWILIFDAQITKYYLQELKSRFHNKRIIFWYWNDIRYALSPNEIPEGIEMWSYSETDCRKWGLSFNTQFLLSEKEDNDDLIQNDVFFVGRDKKRLNELLFFEKIFKEMGINVEFHIVANRNHFVYKNRKKYKKQIPYYKVIEKIQKTRAVFDFYEDPSMGLSLRPFEALQYQKKLITNNKNIELYDFYNTNNIFIIGKDDIEYLTEFLKEPIEDTSDCISRYSFEAWIKRFGI